MDRALRIIGVAIVVALPVFAYRSFDRAVSAATSETGTDADADADAGGGAELGAGAGLGSVAVPSADEATASGDDRVGDGAGLLDAEGEPPEYLAFDATPPPLAALAYRVADLPDARDRDTRRDRDRGRDRDLDGSYPVETDLVPGFTLAAADAIEPGLYASSFAAEGCSYELRRVNRSGEQRLIGQERLADGRLLVSINAIEPDLFSSVPQCRSWAPVVTSGRSPGRGNRRRLLDRRSVRWDLGGPERLPVGEGRVLPRGPAGRRDRTPAGAPNP